MAHGPTVKVAALNLKVTPELRAAAERVAKRENRSLTSLVELALMRRLQEVGEWPAEAK